jgi:hypothetical protein
MFKSGNNHELNKVNCPGGHILYHRAKNGKRVCIECNKMRDRNRIRITISGKRFTVPGTRRL